MLEAQKQQHLRTLRRALNRAVTSLKQGGRVTMHVGWGYGVCWWDPWLQEREGEVPEQEGEPTVLLPPPSSENFEPWISLVPEKAVEAVKFFWPGPLVVRIKLARQDGSTVKCTLACPWQPLAKEFLSRHGAVFYSPVSPEVEELLSQGMEPPQQDEESRVLLWPEPETSLPLTRLDLTTRPWRLMEQGFIDADELLSRVDEPVLLSAERAFPVRSIRTYVPEGKTIIVEARDRELLPEAMRSLREQVPPDAYVRLYLDELIAHNHFPDDREVRVYGELSDPERVRRRLQAMLERQSRRFGKRVLLIGVAEMGEHCDSFRSDLEKLSDSWLLVEEGKKLELGLG